MAIVGHHCHLQPAYFRRREGHFKGKKWTPQHGGLIGIEHGRDLMGYGRAWLWVAEKLGKGIQGNLNKF